MTNQADIGLIGLAVMGENLALNMESRGFTVAVFNRTVERVDEFIRGRAAGKRFIGCRSLEELVRNLAKPRKVMLMIKAGPAVDEQIEKLLPLLSAGDIIIDGGNTHFADTERRTKYVESKGLLFIGTGVSGGEEGALKGPSLMPGGSPAAWPHVEKIFKAIAAKVRPSQQGRPSPLPLSSEGRGEEVPCCEWVGPRGAGHYVKMVHNGIEYGDMQLICEAYYLMQRALGMSNDEMHQVFAEWNRGELDSYLIEITRDILTVKDDETGKDLVDVIMDRAGAKGTGKWMSQHALDLGVPSTLVTEAVYARSLSAMKDERVRASRELTASAGRYEGDRRTFVDEIRQALYASKICSYAQGFVQLREAAKEHDWPLNFGNIALLWRGGCIIRARFLDHIKQAFDADPKLMNLLLAPYFKQVVQDAQPAWRHVVATAVELGIPVPAFTTALTYFDSYRQERLPANLLQAQRDYFGAHTYERIDQPGMFHTDWLAKRRAPA